MGELLTPERLWSIPRVGTPAVAAGRVVVPVTSYDLGENRGTTTLWEVFTNGRAPRRLTTSSASRPVLSPDGNRLAFVRQVDGRGQVHVMAMDGGEPEQVTDLPLGVIGARFMPDGERLVVVANLLRGQLDPEATATERDRRSEQAVTGQSTEQAVFRYWDRWLTTGEVPHLFLVGLDGSVRNLTPDSERWMRWDNTGDPVDDIDISPDGTVVAWCANRVDPADAEIRWALFLTDVESAATRCVTSDLDGHASHPRFSPDGSVLVYGGQPDPHFYADRVRLIEHRLDHGTERTLTADWERSPSGWAFDGEDLVFEAEDDARQPLWRLRPDGSITEIARDGTLGSPLPLGDGTLVATRSRITAPSELVLVSEGVRPITDFTRPALEGVDLPTVEDVRYTGAAERQTQMFVVTPPRVMGPAPLVHMIHGGPHGAWTDVWHWRWHPALFCGSDRRAALVNFHGSTGWGQDYAASIRGAWGDLPATDIERATDHLIETGLADPDRMAITGGSYGGYLVSWLIGQTDRYACAIAHAAVTNLPSMYASDITMGRASAYGAEVWNDLDRVNRWSPAAFSAGYVTPTLVIHGDRDYRVPVGQGLELYGVLKAKGVEARLVHYPDENHWILSPANSIHWYGEVAGWLERFLGAVDRCPR